MEVQHWNGSVLGIQILGLLRGRVCVYPSKCEHLIIKGGMMTEEIG